MQRELRLAKREDFNKVYRYGKSVANQQFVLYYLTNAATEHFRLGISVSKKVGNAVVRNRLRRMVKEIVRHHADEVEQHFDLILIARKPSVDLEFSQMEKSIIHVFKRASLLKRKHDDRRPVMKDS